MPFTLCHPALAIPLHRRRSGLSSLAALVVGSMAPDFVYFVPIGLKGGFTHSLAGIVLYCVPAGMLVLLAYYALVRQPVLAWLPGFLVIAAYVRRWYHTTALSPERSPALTPRQRLSVLSPAGVAAMAGAAAGVLLRHAVSAEHMLFNAVVSGMAAGALAIVALCIGWHARSRRKPDA